MTIFWQHDGKTDIDLFYCQAINFNDLLSVYDLVFLMSKFNNKPQFYHGLLSIIFSFIKQNKKKKKGLYNVFFYIKLYI